MSSREITLRIPDTMLRDLASIARTDDMRISEVIREFIENRIAARQSDEEFRRRLEERLEEDREILDRLAEND
jgi:hypothetical protein